MVWVRMFVAGLRDWIDQRWGDLVAMLILYTGIFIMVKGWGGHIGESLVLAGMAGLKLRTPQNGNGANGTTHAK